MRSSTNSDKINVNQVLIVIDYLHLIDDVGQYLDFDEQTNFQKSDELLGSLHELIEDKGYELSPMQMQSSGLYLSEDFVVEHYTNPGELVGLIHPPFYVNTFNLDDKSVYSIQNLMKELLTSLDPVIVDRGPDSQRYLHSLNYSEWIEFLDAPDDTGILIVQSSKMRVSAVKGLGILLASAAASKNSNVYVGFYGNHPVGMSNSYFVHKGTGKLLWSNYSHTSLSHASLQSLFKSFPIKSIQSH